MQIEVFITLLSASLFGLGILLTWVFKGRGEKATRITITSIFVLLIILSFFRVIPFPGILPLVALMLFMPAIHKKFITEDGDG